MEEGKDKIRFKDLSGWLKTAVVICFVVGIYMALAFFVGVIIGMIGTM
jgi:hypothetical protein